MINNTIKILLSKFSLLKWLNFGFVFFFLFNSCSLEDAAGPIKTSSLKFINEYNISVPEPSGLTFNKDYTALWTVSDNTNHVYKLNLKGKVLKELNFTGNDLEGIAFDKTTGTLWIAEERLREVVNISLEGNELTRKKIDLTGSDNNGLEGICFDSTGTLFLLNEKNPRLFLKLKNDFSIKYKKEINSVGDLSGITYDKKNKLFWIVSDEEKMLFQWSETKGIEKTFSLSYPKAEGVAYNLNNNKIYIVSDKTGKLYEYQIED